MKKGASSENDKKTEWPPGWKETLISTPLMTNIYLCHFGACFALYTKSKFSGKELLEYKGISLLQKKKRKLRD